MSFLRSSLGYSFQFAWSKHPRLEVRDGKTGCAMFSSLPKTCCTGSLQEPVSPFVAARLNRISGAASSPVDGEAFVSDLDDDRQGFGLTPAHWALGSEQKATVGTSRSPW